MWTLVKLILRRDRIKLPLWTVLIASSLVAMVPVLQETYGQQSAIDTLYQTFGVSPAMLFITGPMDTPTFGALMTIETMLWWGLVIAFMNTLLVVRHTRLNEDSGAQELMLSGQLKRHAALTATLLVALIVNAITGLLITLGLLAVSGNLLSTPGVWLFGVGLGVFGMAWASIAAVVVQLVSSSRGANGALASLIGVAFVLRGVGDFMGDTNASGIPEPMWASWFSPFGWLQSTHALTAPSWWGLVTPAVFATLATAAGYWLLSIRDVGQGILPSRRGRARATKLGKSLIGLTWHLQRNITIGWLAAVLIMAGIVGAMAPEMSNIYEGSDSMKSLLEALGGVGAVIPTFMSAMLAMIVLMVVAYVVQAIGRMQSEESTGHLENILATKASRAKWLATHGIVSLSAAFLMLITTGASLAILVNTLTDIHLNVWQYILAGASYMPAVMIFGSIYICLFGVLPRFASLITWTYLGLTVFLTWLAPLFAINEMWLKLSVLDWVPPVPAEPISIGTVVGMLAIALALTAIGMAGWRRRDYRN